MAKERKTVTLGHWVCFLGGRAEVSQRNTAGNPFMTRCECCGWQTGAAPALQQKIFDEAEWLPGATVKKPTMVKEDYKPKGQTYIAKPEPVEQPGQAPEYSIQEPDSVPGFDPSAEPVEQPDCDDEPGSSRRWGGVIAGAVTLVAMGVGMWMS